MTPAEQRRHALSRANRVRRYRARVKQDIATGRLLPDEALLSDHPLLQTMTIEELLHAVPGLGADRVRAILSRNQVRGDVALGALTPAQRGYLLVELRRFRERSKRWQERLEAQA